MALRVVIVDDSPFVREVLREGLSRYPDIEIVGEAADGKRAEALVAELRPDVVTMDVVMPMVGGIDAIRSIMARCPTPIVVVSDIEKDHPKLSLQAIEAGAIDTFAKPRTGFDREAADRLVALLRAAARVRVAQRTPPGPVLAPSQSSLRQRMRRIEFVGIAASTGGPQTLRLLLSGLPRHNLLPIAVVQHTALGFTESLASWLSSSCKQDITVARQGQRIERGMIVIAPDDFHLEIGPGGIARLHHGPKVGSHRPSGTLLFRSLAESYKARAAGIVLTGMGDDGAEGAAEIEKRGGLVLVEKPELAILEGMPRATLARTEGAVATTIEELGRLLVRSSEY